MKCVTLFLRSLLVMHDYIYFMFRSLIITLLVACSTAFSQSVESGSAFNKYMSPDAGINPLSGTVSFSVPIATLSAGSVSTSFSLNYSGNVSQSVKSRNDLSPTGWVGLGWSMGFAKIVSDNSHSMSLLDDFYYLVTAEGLRYKLIYDGSRWWVEGLPYWLVERKVETKVFDDKTFEIVVGWILTDDSGNRYQYGDLSYCENNGSVSACSEQGATSYELGFPAYGHTGESIGGTDVPYPVSWNLAKISDWKENSIRYFYKQIQEGVKHGSWNSQNRYTKEIYLEKVKSSMGSFVKFVLAEKNQGDFEGEVVDAIGKEELDIEDENDAFIDPVERKFLSKIELYGMDGKVLQTVGICYSPLKVSPSLDADENKKYVKRLLTSIVWANGDGKEVKRESYSYYDNVYKAYFNEKYELGLMKEIQGANCGKVKFDYLYQAVDKMPSSVHSEQLPVVSVSLGYLEDGTPYLLGLDKAEEKVVVYYWQYGAWNIRKVLSGLPYNENGFFIVGKNNWFAYVTDRESSYDMYPVVWDGTEWQICSPIHDDGSKNLVLAGPNYIVKGRLSSSDNALTLTVPWSLWGGTYVIDTLSADEGSMDNQFLQIYPSENHIAVSYIGPKWINNYRVRIFSFKYDSSGITFEKTYEENELDDDNRYYWGNGYLFGALESNGLWGQRAKAVHWNGSGWTKLLDYDVHGMQRVPRAQAVGYNYVALRHKDNYDLTLFDWDGDNWNVPVENRNMVHHDDYDLLEEAEWDALGSGEFFVTRRPLVDNVVEIPCFCWPSYKRWGVRWKCKFIKVWSETHPAANIELFERRNGEWRRNGEVNTDKSKKEKQLVVGSNWYIEKRSNKAYLWDGVKWNEEQLDVQWSHIEDISFPTDSMPNYITVFNETTNLGDFVAVEGYAGQPDEGTTTIYYKKNDSFLKKKGVFLVSRKTIQDPVLDKEFSYEYIYNFDNAPEVGFDYLNNTALITSFRVKLPDNSGMVERELCPIDSENVGLGLGKVCAERTYTGEVVEKSSVSKYSRYRQPGWPNLLHIDAISSVETNIKGVRNKDSIEYNVALNGMPSRELVYENDFDAASTERVYRYSAEVYPFEKEANHLHNPVLSYSCKPNCSSGKVVEATAARYADANSSIGTPHILEEWVYNPLELATGSSFLGIPWSITESPGGGWIRSSRVSGYWNGFAVEKTDALGNKTARIIDDDFIAFERATVVNAGIDEILVVPGDRCSENRVEITNCHLLGLQGTATDGEGVTTGRFSRNVIDLRFGFSGLIRLANHERYRFSAWVQNADNVSASVSLTVNGTTKQSWTLDGDSEGKWHYIEWMGDIDAGSVNVSLSGSGNIRAQDIRMIPTKASASVKFYDAHFGLPVVDVDDRGVGRYLVLDGNGRIKKTYGEDEFGNLRLLSENEYVESRCSDPTKGSGNLASLTFDSKPILLSTTDRSLQYVLAGNKEDVIVSWKTENEDDVVRYRLYPDGESEQAKWHFDCCTSTDNLNVSLEQNNSYTLEIDVGADSVDVYSVHMQRASTGWTRYGNVLRKGENPLFLDDEDSTRIAFASSEGVFTADYAGSSWNENLVTVQKSKNLAGMVAGTTGYILSMPRIMIVDSSSNENGELFSGTFETWSNNGKIFDAPVYGIDFAMAADASGRPCVAYTKVISQDSSLLTSLVSSCFENNSWNPIGGLTVFESNFGTAPTVVPGVVENGEIFGVDLARGPGNKLYVAYVARNPYFELHKSEIRAQYGDSISFPKQLLIKRLFDSSESGLSGTESIWAGPNLSRDSATTDMLPNYLGDAVTIDDTIPITMVRRLKIAGDANYVYLAVAYGVEVDSVMKTAISVFKGEFIDTLDADEIPEHRLRFVPYEDESIEQSSTGLPVEQQRRIVAYIEEDSPFDFAVRNGVPYILFENSQNGDALTLVSYRNSRWLSVGIPAFIKADKTPKSASLAFGADGTPVVAVRASSRDTRSRRLHIVPMKYVSTDDVDQTLSGIQVSGATTSLSSEFRQYILNYSAKVSSEDSVVEISPSLMEPLDVSSVQVLLNGKQVSYTGVNFFGALISWVVSIFSPGYNFQDSTSELHLEPGENQIEINIIGTNGVSLAYTIHLFREYPETSIPDTDLEYNVVTNSDLILVGAIPDTALYVSRGDSAYRKFCVQLPFGIRLWFKGTEYYRSTCVDLDFSKTKLDTLILENENGDKRVILVEDDNTSEIGEEMDDGGEDDGGGDYDENIPLPYRPLLGHKVYSTGNLVVSDRASVSADEVVAKNVEVGAGASVLAEMTVEGDVLLRSNSNVEDITLGGNLQAQNGVSYGMVEYRDVHVADIPVSYFVTGVADITVYSGATANIVSGAYKDFHAYANSSVRFEPGEYFFENFIVEPDANIYFEGPVRLWVQNVMSVADRVNLSNQAVGAENVFIYTNTSNSMYFGVNSDFAAVLVAPYASVNVAPHSRWQGLIWSKNIYVQADAVIE